MVMASLAVLKSRTAGRLTGLGLMALAMAACTTTGPRSDSMRVDVGRYVVGPAYQVNGTTYTPQEDFAYAAVGTASWFGGEVDGRSALTGETIRADELLAAHRTLQLPSLVRVTSLDTGLSVVMRVVDREPVEGNAVIGISRRAAELLGIERGPPSRVEVRILSAESLALAEMAGRPSVGALASDVPAAPSRPLETAAAAEALPGPAEDVARARLESAGLVPGGIDSEPITPQPLDSQAAAADEGADLDTPPDSELLAGLATADRDAADGPAPDAEPTASDGLDQTDTVVVGGASLDEAQDRVDEARAEEVSQALALAAAEAARVASAREAQLEAERERLEAEAAARAALVARAEAEARAATAAAAAADAVSDQPVVDASETPAALADRRADEQTRAVAEARSIYPSLGLSEPDQPDQPAEPRQSLGSDVQTVSVPRRAGSSGSVVAEAAATAAAPDVAEEAGGPAAENPSPPVIRPTGPSGLSAALVPAAEGTATRETTPETPAVTVAPVEAAVPPASEPTSSGPTRFFVQAGAFAVFDNAERLTERLSDIGSTSISPIVIDGRELFRVWVGPYLSVTDANGARDQLVGIGFGDARIVID